MSCSTRACRITTLGMLLLRDNLPFRGWTQGEIQKLRHHINHTWLPLVKEYLSELYADDDDALKQAGVLKFHLLLVHVSERLLTHGPLQVSYTGNISKHSHV